MICRKYDRKAGEHEDVLFTSHRASTAIKLPNIFSLLMNGFSCQVSRRERSRRLSLCLHTCSEFIQQLEVDKEEKLQKRRQARAAQARSASSEVSGLAGPTALALTQEVGQVDVARVFRIGARCGH